MAAREIALQMKGVSKRYPGTLAVDRMDFTVYTGEVHALIGENGAGKSTLVKILAGSFEDYTGQIFLGSREVALHSPAIARKNGIQMIHQELSLALPLSIAENILVGRLPVKRGFWLDTSAMRQESRRCMERVGLDLDPMTPVEEISRHEAQLVEIAKALGNNPRILVMDEPTSALSRTEVERLFGIIHRLREQGLAIVYISHHLTEIFEVADRVTVMRDSNRIATESIRDVSSKQLVEMMVGRSVSELYAARKTEPGAVKIQVERLSRYGFFHDISFSVRSGEVLGIAGLAGAGRSEMARSLCGIDPVHRGTVYLNGKPVRLNSFKSAIRAGLAYLTEDRKEQGLALRLCVGENILSASVPRHCRSLFYSARKGQPLLDGLIKALRVHPTDPSAITASLSGGNQQKVLLSKWLATDPEVLILDEPTRGVDVGAKVIIHRAIADIADRGKSVILISSDLPELVALSDRIMIMRKGRLIGELTKAECTEESVLLAINGQGAIALS